MITGAHPDISVAVDPENQHGKKERSFVDLGPMKDIERRDLNYVVKEYLLFAGYRLTAMTFYEEVNVVLKYSTIYVYFVLTQILYKSIL